MNVKSVTIYSTTDMDALQELKDQKCRVIDGSANRTIHGRLATLCNTAGAYV